MRLDEAIIEFAELLSVGSCALEEVLRPRSESDLEELVNEVKTIADRLGEISIQLKRMADK